MTPPDQTTDRYISFCGIECDANADKLIEMLKLNLSQKKGGGTWGQYFEMKFKEQHSVGSDNLHFIGNQLNPLYEYFEACGDSEAEALLYQIEQECC
ncbi:hypothetical protein GCM10011369_32770 [Neiella marina]|uniref:N(2)-fixation sustaining protein CowN n=1 Tax=Neiella marina TaxID=508461 RepID=A0A8J2XR99_9GAMM|nr:N(2)-fixation sustaining protein CowN [Neiella marina]GGA88108.1 hypothetical protein GCM10011369_32770 [Neiella marina]